MNLRLAQVRLQLASFTLEIDATFDRPITGVFGPSGAGKTSLLDLIARKLLAESSFLQKLKKAWQSSLQRSKSTAKSLDGEGTK